jgi:hypothetical protein
MTEANRKLKLKEIPFGAPIDDPGGYCIYANGHIDPLAFLDAVRSMKSSETPNDVRMRLTTEDVKHLRFRPLSPTEAKRNGASCGIYETETGGYPITAVKI